MDTNNSALNTARLAGPGELLSSAWAFYKRHWQFLASLYAIPALVMYAANLLFLAGEGWTTALGTLLALIGGIWSVVVFPASVRSIQSYYADPNAILSLQSQYKIGLRYFWPFVWVMVLQNLILAGSLVLLVIPAIIVGIYIGFAQLSVVAEDKRGHQSFLHSYSLVYGRWWPVLGRMLVVGLMVVAIAFLLGAAGSLVGSAAGVDMSTDNNVVAHTVNLIITALLVPFSLIYLYNLYTSLKSTSLPSVNTEPFRKWLVAFTVIGVIAIITFIVLMALGVGYLASIFIPR